MDSDEISLAHIGIPQLVYVGDVSRGDLPGQALASSSIAQAPIRIIMKARFPKNSFVDLNGSVRAIVVVNRRSVTWFPAEHQHLDKLVPTDEMPPIIGFLKTDIGPQVVLRDRNTLQPGVQKVERGMLADIL